MTRQNPPKTRLHSLSPILPLLPSRLKDFLSFLRHPSNVFPPLMALVRISAFGTNPNIISRSSSEAEQLVHTKIFTYDHCRYRRLFLIPPYPTLVDSVIAVSATTAGTGQPYGRTRAVGASSTWRQRSFFAENPPDSQENSSRQGKFYCDNEHKYHQTIVLGLLFVN